MRCLCLTFAIAMHVVPARADRIVTLNTLEWCPYTCSSQADGGFTAEIVREAFRHEGFELRLRFLPWLRAVREAETGGDAVGFFPEYPTERREFTFSPVIGEGPIGLIVPTGAKVPDLASAELGRYRIGVVNGYVNARPIADAIASGALKPHLISNDEAGIRMVALGRLDAAEIDRYVFAWAMRNQPEFRDLRSKVVFGATLETKTLHIAFARNARGAEAATAFAEGLKRVDVMAAQRRYLAMVRGR